MEPKKWSSILEFFWEGHTTASDRERGSFHRAHLIGIKEDDNHSYVIMEMSPHSSLYLLQIRVSHLSFLCCFLQRHLHQSPCNPLHWSRVNLWFCNKFFRKRKTKQEMGLAYVSWVVLNDVNSFLVAELFP